MTKVILILLAGLICEAIGVVYLSAGMKQLNGASEIDPRLSVAKILRLAKAGVTNKKILLGIAWEAVFFAVLCYLLTQRDVSLIWPLSALSFVFTGVAAKLFLDEYISPLRWAGILLIVFGAGIITWSEKLKEREAARPGSGATLCSPPDTPRPAG